MPGTSLATAAYSLKVALRNAAVTAIADPSVLVCHGLPRFDNQPPDVVQILGVSSEQTEATLGTNRSREEILTAVVRIMVAREGDDSQELVAYQRAYQLLGAIEFYCRQTDTTLGSVVRQCFLTAHVADSLEDPSTIAWGRMVGVTAEFTAHVRITG